MLMMLKLVLEGLLLLLGWDTFMVLILLSDVQLPAYSMSSSLDADFCFSHGLRVDSLRQREFGPFAQ